MISKLNPKNIKNNTEIIKDGKKIVNDRGYEKRTRRWD